MYELVIKILGENDYKKYTIQEIEEMKAILQDLKTGEVRLRQIERKINDDNNSLRLRKSKKKID